MCQFGQKCGTYYEGYVDDLGGYTGAALTNAVSTWGVCRSQKKPSEGTNKENELASLYIL